MAPRRYGNFGNEVASRVWKGRFMISVEQAFKVMGEAISHACFPLKTKTVSLLCSQNLYLAEDVYADRPQPPFHRVAMDGIALHKQAVESGQIQFKIIGIQEAGASPYYLENSTECVEVMTGAVLPHNTHLVVPYEMIEIKDGVASLQSGLRLQEWQNIHLLGSDYQEGEKLLIKGEKIVSVDIAILATVGKSDVLVYDLPPVAVVSTGDELVDINEDPLAHQIRRSNPYVLSSELLSHGFEKVDLFHAEDDKEQLISLLDKLINRYPIVVLSGGVSMGKLDFVPEVLESLGVERKFHKIKQRPGKPLWFGVKNENHCIIGLPGNPVSCLISLRRYLIESFLERRVEYQKVQGVLNENFSFSKRMTYFLPVKVKAEQGQLLCEIIKMNGSGDFFSLAKSDGFLELPEEREEFHKGESYPLYFWGKSL